MARSSNRSCSDAKSDRAKLLERRLARSEAAREEAEQLLHTKSRSLAAAQELLQQKETQLLEQVNRQTLSLITAQTLAKVATFHGDESQRFTGSENFAEVVGSKTPVTSFDQFAKMVHPLDREEALKMLLSAEKGELVDKQVVGDFRFLGHDGKTRWLRWAVTQHQSTIGAGFFGYGAIRDITEERQAERQEQLLLKLSERRARQLEKISEDLGNARADEKKKSEQLEQRVIEMEMMSAELDDARAKAVAADRSKSRFLAMMSHDIRTPLNAILATLELLSITDLDADQAKKVELAHQSSDQLLFLLADIIEIARTDGWKLELELGEFHLPQLVEQAAETWRPLAAKKNLVISTEISPQSEDFLISDKTRVRQLIDNFVSNAIKYTSEGNIYISAKTMTDPTGPAIEFTVSDTGPGIPKDIQARLFDDLDRGDVDSELIEGTGLGLSICKRIAKAMGGEIGVESEVDRGSKFWVRLPVTVGDGSRASENRLQKPSISQFKIDDRAPKLLVAEDVEANQIVLASLLENLGCESVIVDDGSKVLGALESESFDGIFMDVWMPTNGMEATKQVRANTKYQEIPIFGVTAFAADEERAAILASGMDGVIAKPINIAGLTYALEQICGSERSTIDEHADGTVPDLSNPEYIDVEKFREQLLAVPLERREILIGAVVSDIETWSKKFQRSWVAKDKEGVSAAHHALRGICDGFGAYSLLEKLESIRQTETLGDGVVLLPIENIEQQTISALRRSNQMADRRTD
ncbi:MAG: ATP-binding protein [Parasphingorhabdus sp.]